MVVATAEYEPDAVIRMSRRDWKGVLTMLKKPAKPNCHLQAATNRYNVAKANDAGTAFNWTP